MFNKKKNRLFDIRKEQIYLKNLIEKTNNPIYINMYNEFEDIISYKDLEKFIIKYKDFIKKDIKIDTKKTLNELKEKVAYELIEYIYSKKNN